MRTGGNSKQPGRIIYAQPRKIIAQRRGRKAATRERSKPKQPATMMNAQHQNVNAKQSGTVMNVQPGKGNMGKYLRVDPLSENDLEKETLTGGYPKPRHPTTVMDIQSRKSNFG